MYLSGTMQLIVFFFYELNINYLKHCKTVLKLRIDRRPKIYLESDLRP